MVSSGMASGTSAMVSSETASVTSARVSLEMASVTSATAVGDCVGDVADVFFVPKGA